MKTVLVALILASALALGAIKEAVASESVLQVPVLMYHRITKPSGGMEDSSRWIAPARFEAQLKLLRKKGWRTITARRLGKHLRQERPLGRKRFVISIDDGASDGYLVGGPILDRLGMRATYCINPGRIGKSGKMTWDQIRELKRGGHEIANHSLTHADLTAIGNRALTREIWLAQRQIDDATGRRPVTMCYPFGRHDRKVRSKASNAGIYLGLTTRSGGRHTRSGRLMSPRIRIDGSDSPETVLRKVMPFRDS